MRIVLFVGSPLVADEGEVTKLAKRLKKEKVNVDIVSFGDHQKNNDLLTAFINALNGKEGTGSHLVSVPRGSQLQEALISSPIIQGEDGKGVGIGAGFEFGVDPNEDPELALVSFSAFSLKYQTHDDFSFIFRPFVYPWRNNVNVRRKSSVELKLSRPLKLSQLVQLQQFQQLRLHRMKLCLNVRSLSQQRLR
jgi:hypothetical protein